MKLNEYTLYYSVTPYGIIKLIQTITTNNIPYSIRLYIDDGLQFDSKDEYRYHQSVFGLPFLLLNIDKLKKILVLGGGDGLGVKVLLEEFEDKIEKIDLVDISKDIIFIFQNRNELLLLNEGSLLHPKTNIYIMDAKDFIEKTEEKYDLIILDYPDPSMQKDSPLNELFTAEHYKKIKELLKEDGVIALQATSAITPNVLRKIELEINKIFPNSKTARVPVNSFGDISVIFASKNNDLKLKQEIPENFFFNKKSINNLFNFFKDEKPDIDDQTLEQISIESLIEGDIFFRGNK